MLRRRRTCNPQELSLSLGSFVRDSNAEETRRKKRKLVKTKTNELHKIN